MSDGLPTLHGGRRSGPPHADLKKLLTRMLEGGGGRTGPRRNIPAACRRFTYSVFMWGEWAVGRCLHVCLCHRPRSAALPLRFKRLSVSDSARARGGARGAGRGQGADGRGRLNRSGRGRTWL